MSVVSPLVFEFATLITLNAVFLQYRKHLINNSV